MISVMASWLLREQFSLGEYKQSSLISILVKFLSNDGARNSSLLSLSIKGNVLVQVLGSPRA